MKILVAILPVLILPEICYAQHTKSISDTAAIRMVLNSFNQAIIKKDTLTLSSVFANGPIGFRSVRGVKTVAYLKNKDISTLAVQVRDYKDFIRSVAQTKDNLEEKFYHVNIKTDGGVASLSSDYSFWRNNQKINWGQENWELMFNGTDWKIVAIIWSTNLEVAEKEPMTN